MENRTYSTDPRTLLIEKIDDRIKKEKEEGRALGRISKWLFGDTYHFYIDDGITRRWVEISDAARRYQRLSPVVGLHDLEGWRMGTILEDKKLEHQIFINMVSKKERFNPRILNLTYHFPKGRGLDTFDIHSEYMQGFPFYFRDLSVTDVEYHHLGYLIDHLTTLTGSPLPSNLPASR